MLGILRPRQGGDPIVLKQANLLIGRRDFCDITIPFANVSSRHCELEFNDGYWFARDLNSTNGTRIDGKICQYECVRPGSILAIGRHRFTLDYEPEGDPPPLPEKENIDEQVLSERLLDKAGIEAKGTASSANAAAPSERKLDASQSKISAAEKALDPKQRGLLCPIGGGSPIPLSQDHMLVGRDRSCDIRLSSATVSSRHCELELIDGFWLVRDLGSHNGTKVNGTKIEQKWLLPKSELQLSNLRFKILYRPPAGAPIPKDIGVSFTRSLLDRAGLKRRR